MTRAFLNRIKRLNNQGKIGQHLIGFGIGILVGYSLGLIRVHENAVQLMQSSKATIENLVANGVTDKLIAAKEFATVQLERLLSFSPNMDFLSDVVAYQAAVIAIAIPLSLEVVSRISERYKSGVIINEFNKQREFRWILIIAPIDAILAVSLNFFISSSPTGISKGFAWVVFSLFIVSNFVLIAFFNVLRRYTTQTRFLIEKLSKDLQRTLDRLSLPNKIRQKQIVLLQERLVDALNGIGDILVFETTQKRSKDYILSGFRQIQSGGQKIFELQKSNPERLEAILYSQNFLQLQEINQTEASLQLAFFPEKHSVTLLSVINQFIRVYEAASESKSEEIERFAVYNITWLLRFVSQYQGNKQSVEMLLRTLAEIRYSREKRQDYLSHILNTHWYTTIVFDEMFCIDYLGLFNRDLLSCIHEIISKKQDGLFEDFIRHIYQSGNLGYHVITLDGFEAVLMQADHDHYIKACSERNLGQKIRTLKVKVRQLKNLTQLNECIALLENIKVVVVNYFTDSLLAFRWKWYCKIQNERPVKAKVLDLCLISLAYNLVPRGAFTEASQESVIEKVGELLNEINLIFKFNIFLDLLFDFGAYCIFKNKFNYIYLLWNFGQPGDAVAIWAGKELVPQSLSEIFRLYIENSISRQIYSISWEDRHGSKRYYELYFLILVLREFVRPQVIERDTYQSIINGFQLSSHLNSYQLSNIKTVVQCLISRVDELDQFQASFGELGFNTDHVDEAISRGIQPFLREIEEKADNKIERLKINTKISSNKIKIFCNKFIDGYYKAISVTKLFQSLDKYEEREIQASDHVENIKKTAIKMILDKSIFFDSWYVKSDHLGYGWGGDFSRNKGKHLILQLMRLCKSAQIIDIEEVIGQFEEELENLFIIGINISVDSRFIDSLGAERFKPKWNTEVPKVSIPELLGFYIYKNHPIPVARYFYRFPEQDGVPDKLVLLLSKKQLPKLVQYFVRPSPQEETDCFEFQVKSFSEDDSLMEQYLTDPPDVPMKIGDASQQKEHLKKCVLLEIYERFELEVTSSPIGYVMPVED